MGLPARHLKAFNQRRATELAERIEGDPEFKVAEMNSINALFLVRVHDSDDQYLATVLVAPGLHPSLHLPESDRPNLLRRLLKRL